MDQITRYFTGWEYVVPAILVAAFATSYLLRSTRPRLAAWGIVVPWLGLFLATYIVTSTGRYLINEKVAWLAITLTFLLLMALPIGVVAAYVYSGHARRQKPYLSGLIGTAIGVAFIPLLHIISRQAAILLFRFVPVG